ncbi:MAG: hypothetical protein M1827_001649 [Pycnora praestabilis]|nr:MAG: hypothetical protein M1827_001649 [Pycnora praestabilis]
MTATEAISNPSMLEAACTQIADWEPPRAGLHKLSFLRHPLPLEVAVHSAFPLQGISVTSTIPPQLVSAFQPSGSWDALIHLLPSLSELYLLFEQVLLCEPIVVLAKNPQLCSEFVSAIVDLVRPVPFAGDVRPYITMQSEFFNNNIGGRATRHYLIGITNPFLLKRISALSEDIGSSTPHIVYLQGSSAAVPIRLHHHRHQIHVDYQVPGAMSPPNRARGHISKDQTFLKNIDTMLRSNGSDAAEVSSVIRRHFAYITGAFLAPINRYLATLMSSSAITSPGGNLQYSHFSEVDFLQSLSKHGTSIQFKGQTSIHRHKAEAAFYSKFCRSSNFYSWLEMKLGLEKEAFAGAVGQGTIQGQKTEWPWLPGGCIE